jgi:peptidoglycan-associated lipoprotein
MKEDEMKKGQVRLVVLMLLVAALVVSLGCGGKKVRPLEEDEAAMEAARRKAMEEEEARRKAEEAEREAVKPIEPAEDESLGFKPIHFDYDKYNLTGKAISTLSTNAEILMDHPELDVVIEGHCDERGTDEYNLALGEKRALAARDFLVNFGIAKSRISVISYGEEKPVDPGSNEEAWAKNRRAEFVTK